jgi:hypothetical protein
LSRKKTSAFSLKDRSKQASQGGVFVGLKCVGPSENEWDRAQQRHRRFPQLAMFNFIVVRGWQKKQ